LVLHLQTDDEKVFVAMPQAACNFQYYTHQQPADRLQAEHVGIAALHLAKAVMEIHTISIAHVSKTCP
jgi:hypothetical protein